MKRSKQPASVQEVADTMCDLEATVAKLCKKIEQIRSGSEVEKLINQRDIAIRLCEEALDVATQKSSSGNIQKILNDLKHLKSHV